MSPRLAPPGRSRGAGRPQRLAEPPPMIPNPSVVDAATDEWQARMRFIVQTMREMSLQVDPQEMVRTYGARMRQIMPADRWLSLSRRDLEAPRFRITRSSTWQEVVNPWQEKERLPVFSGGLLGELIHSNEPRLIDDLRV